MDHRLTDEGTAPRGGLLAERVIPCAPSAAISLSTVATVVRVALVPDAVRGPLILALLLANLLTQGVSPILRAPG